MYFTPLTRFQIFQFSKDFFRQYVSSYNSFIGSMDRKFFPKASELSEFYPELEEKKASKPQLVEDTIKESSKILDLKIHNNDDLSSQ